MVPVTEYTQFVIDFDNGKHPHERFGQAFLNKFHDYPEVAAQRSNSKIWEGTNKADIIPLLYELKLI